MAANFDAFEVFPDIVGAVASRPGIFSWRVLSTIVAAVMVVVVVEVRQSGESTAPRGRFSTEKESRRKGEERNVSASREHDS